ncbi:MAG TPA: hypothetical protein VD948_02390 [Rhodothermales bacterium]|nr:hypothetical protein [Rhodothermales bacterium]
MPTMLDLFAGRGGASRVMRERGWRVVTVDVDPAFGCDVTGDVRTFRWDGGPVDLLWASPPCTEFARESMPWCRTGAVPDMNLVCAALFAVDRIKPRFWVIENVRGSVPWIRALLGPPRFRSGPVYLWGNLPPGLLPQLRPWKSRLSSDRADLRAEMPRELSHAIAIAVERATTEAA